MTKGLPWSETGLAGDHPLNILPQPNLERMGRRSTAHLTHITGDVRHCLCFLLRCTCFYATHHTRNNQSPLIRLLGSARNKRMSIPFPPQGDISSEHQRLITHLETPGDNGGERVKGRWGFRDLANRFVGEISVRWMYCTGYLHLHYMRETFWCSICSGSTPCDNINNPDNWPKNTYV